jgi:hypothetical protein
MLNKMPQKLHISKDLQQIIKDAACSETYNINENITKIQEKQYSSLEFYLLAMVQRLDVV